MLSNQNTSMAFNSYKEMSQLPYKIIEVLLTDKSQDAEDFWKILKYVDIDALEHENLTYEEKLQLIWKQDAVEQNYSIFLKPLVGSSLDGAEAQTQLRLFRYTTSPTDRLEAIVCFEADFITHEKTSMIYKDDILSEKTDVLETLFLNIMNGRDIAVGSGVFEFNRELSRSCNSQLNIGNSKTFYGRSLIMALQFIGGDTGGTCG